MSSEVRNHSSSPPLPPDEAYWEALLHEGEDAATEGGPQEQHVTFWEDAPSSSTKEGQAAEDQPDGSSADWEEVREAFETDATAELRVIGHNRGGLLVAWNSLRGFVPASQLVDFPAAADGRARLDALAQRIGQCLLLRVIELDRAQNRLILSERAAQVQPGTRAYVLSTNPRGGCVPGPGYQPVCDFGVFVDLGGLEGLIHISELSLGACRASTVTSCGAAMSWMST